MLEEAVELYEIDTNPENFEELVFEYRKLLRQDKENNWKRADLAALAGKTWGKLRRLADETGDSYNYLRQLSYVSSQYDKSQRKLFDKLTFSHFRAVAHLPERYVWLQRAQTQSWGVDQLRRAVGRSKGEEKISLKQVVNTLNEISTARLQGIDAMGLLNLALGQIGAIKWNGHKFDIENQ